MEHSCRFSSSTILVCFLLATDNVSAEVPVLVDAHLDLKLSEEQKQELIAAPITLLVRQPSELLQRALKSQEIEKAVVIEDDASRLNALIYYAPIVVSETRKFEPLIVCEGNGNPPEWTQCWDNSDTYVTLPGLNPIAVDHPETSAQRVQNMLTVVDAAQLQTPNNVPITAKDVNHVLLRRNVGIYIVIATNRTTYEDATINLRPVLRGGRETYEITEYSCK